MAYGNVNVDTVTTSTSGGVLGAGNASIMKNRCINGDMRIDQRNAGAATANTINGYTLDRWVVQQTVTGKLIAQQNAGSITPPTGFNKYLGVTSQSAYSLAAGNAFGIYQFIEGFNTADLGWGTANAKTVTLSFQVYSSLTGTFGGSLNNNNNYSYPFTYSIPVANTWTTISITVIGPTGGTWTSDNSVGIAVNFGLGVGTTYSGTAGAWASGLYLSPTGATSVVGTSGATFYITGVQVEVGSSATGFEYRQYGQELALCQRYFVKIGGNFLYDCIFIGFYTDSVTFFASYPLPVTMRTTPTVTSNALYVDNGAGGGAVTALSVIANQTNPQIGYISATTTNGTLGRSANMRGNNSTSNYLSYSAEL